MAALPAQDPGRATPFYLEKVGFQALESDFLKARHGGVGLAVGDGVNQLFVYPARVRSSGEFTQAVIHVTDARCRRGDEGPRRWVRGVRHAGDADRKRRCCDAGWRRGGVVQGLRRQPGRRCSSLRRISRVSELPRRVAYPARSRLRTGGSAWGEPSGRSRLRAALNRSDFLPEQWKRQHTSADRVGRTVRKYAWLCIKRAPG
jgi:hypothetical protein